MSAFSLHFSFDVDVENAIIYEKIHGIWLAKTAQEYHVAFVEEVKPLLGKPWAKLVNLTNWKTSYPEVTDIIGKHLAWCMENGLALSINILSAPSTERQLGEMFAKGATAGISHIFRTIEEGQAYLREHWTKSSNSPF